MNPNQTSALVVKRYDATYPILIDLRAYASTRAPDQKSRNRVHDVMSLHSNLQYARDMLYSLYYVFDALRDRSWDKAEYSANADAHTKHRNRADFYRRIAQWALACYDLVKEAPVIVST